MFSLRRARRFGFVHLLVLSFGGCTTLTQVDWSRIPAEVPGGGSGGSGNAGGEPPSDGGDTSQGGVGAQGGENSGGESLGGEGGAGGEPGAGGFDSGATGGSAQAGSGMGGVSGGGGTSGGTGGGGGTGGSGGTGGGGDVAPKCSTYPATPAVINLTGKTVMFDGGVQADGEAWGGRDGLDAKCAAAATTLGLKKQQIRAFLATTPGEDLIPGDQGNFVSKFNVPGFVVVSPLGITIADNAVTLTSFKKSLICAGVVHADASAWLSGVKEGGLLDPTLTCENWSSREDSTIIHAGVGLTDTTNANFHDHLLADHWVSCNTTSAHLLCLAWEDAP